MKFCKLYQMKLPDRNTANPALYELYVTSNVWVALLNNSASEQSARMNAMENASKNAKEILDVLKTKYNKARQTRITIELVEIISGASAV
jgi:F-type H+-transporting ATPase subunit gamma